MNKGIYGLYRFCHGFPRIAGIAGTYRGPSTYRRLVFRPAAQAYRRCRETGYLRVEGPEPTRQASNFIRHFSPRQDENETLSDTLSGEIRQRELRPRDRKSEVSPIGQNRDENDALTEHGRYKNRVRVRETSVETVPQNPSLIIYNNSHIS